MRDLDTVCQGARGMIRRNAVQNIEPAEVEAVGESGRKVNGRPVIGRRCGDRFRFEPRGTFKVKGRDAEVDLFEPKPKA